MKSKQKKKNKSPRVLLFDIENSFMKLEVKTFGLKMPKFLSHKTIKRDSYIVSIAWKWLGDKKVNSLSLLDFPKQFEKDHTNDRHLLEAFSKIYNEADVVVAHNGDGFDIKKLNTRIIQNKLPALKKVLSVDTLKQVRKIARFPSNRLDYIAPALGYEGKMEAEGLWDLIEDGGKSQKAKTAIRKMVRYNKKDIDLLEYVYKWLLPYMQGHPHIGVIKGEKPKLSCSNCGSTNITKKGFMYTKTKKYQRLGCNDCGHADNKGEVVK